MSEVPFGSDGNFSEELMVERRNSDLCNVLGNLVNRTIAMTNKYFGGTVKRPENYTALDLEVSAFLNLMDAEVEEKVEKLDLPNALALIFARLERLNKYIDETAPWILAKDPDSRDRLNDVLYTILDGIRMCTLQLQAFIPNTAQRIYDQLQLQEVSFTNYEFGSVDSYSVTSKPEILFARIDEAELKARLAEEEDVKKIEHKAEIEFADFEKLEMVVGEVVSCVKHPKADKLLISQVDFGGETRQIVSGIAEFYTAEQMKGRKVVALLNLKPRKIRGEESNGMLLTSENVQDGKESVELLSSTLPVGSRIC